MYIAQADALISAGVNCDIFIVLDVPDNVLVDRVTGRRLDPLTGQTYHITSNPPPEDTELLARLIQRSDDTAEKLMVRLNAYHDAIGAIESRFSSDVIFHIDGNRPIAAISEDIRTKLAKLYPKT